MFKLLVCGGRDFEDKYGLYNVLNILHDHYTITNVIHGGAIGADQMGGSWAKENNIRTTEFLPNYKRHGKLAPLIRNTSMAEQKPNLVVGFPGSNGTFDMITKSIRGKIDTLVFNPEHSLNLFVELVKVHGVDDSLKFFRQLGGYFTNTKQQPTPLKFV